MTTSVAALAPAPAAAWSQAIGLLTRASDSETMRALAGVVGDRLRLSAGDLPIEPANASERRLAPDVGRFAEQFTVDVSQITPEHRQAAFAALGDDAFPTVQALYVLDIGARMNAAFRLLLATTLDPAPPAPGSDLWSTLEEFMRNVAVLDALDPATTEIVRLRGARAHNCRLCQSLRNVTAVRAGVSEADVAAIDQYEVSSLSARHKTALRFVDAMIWQPGAWPSGLATEIGAAFAPPEIAHLVFAFARNSANKIAVSFGADDPHVVDGVEYYDVDEHGELAYGLSL